MSLGENSLVAAYQGKGQLKSRPSGTRVVTITKFLGSCVDVETIIENPVCSVVFRIFVNAQMAFT